MLSQSLLYFKCPSYAYNIKFSGFFFNQELAHHSLRLLMELLIVWIDTCREGTVQPEIITCDKSGKVTWPEAV